VSEQQRVRALARRLACADAVLTLLHARANHRVIAVPQHHPSVAALMTVVALASMGCPLPNPYPQRPPTPIYRRDANPRTDIQTALLEAVADHKLVLLIFGANWCPPCWALSATLSDRRVRPFLEDHFHVVEIDIGNFNRNVDVSTKYGYATEQGIPSAVVLGPSGEVIALTKGHALGEARDSAGAMLRYLSDCAEALDSAPARPAPQALFDPAQLVSHADTLTARFKSDSIGTLVLQLDAGLDSLVSTTVQVTHGNVLQHEVVTLDPQSLRPRVVRDSWPAVRLNLVFAAGRVRGTRIVRDTLGAVDTVALNLRDSSVFDRLTLLDIIPSFPLGIGWSATVPVFDSRSLTTVPVRIAVTERTSISVPAGTFDTYRVEVTGDLWALPTILYISAAHRRRVVRIERPQAQFTVDLAR
jgi:thioredoxin 1